MMRQAVPESIKQVAGQQIRMVNFWPTIVAPLIVEDQVIGMLSVQADDLNEDDVPTITAFAHQVAAAWHRARLFEQAQQEIAERQRAEDALTSRVRQQAAVAELGQRALVSAQLPTLMQEAVALVGETLEVEYCKVLELLPGKDVLLLQAGIGWQEGLIGNATVDGGIDSQAGYTLISAEPVIVEDLRSESRFRGPALLHDHGVVSGISVIIGSRDQPFGILGAHTSTHRTFTRDDILFLQSIANTLATATERQRAEAERERLLAQIQEQVQQVQQIINTVPEGVVLLDAAERVILVNPVAERDLVALADIGVGDAADKLHPLVRLGDRPLVELLTSPPEGLWHEITADGQSFQVIARPIETGPTPGGWVLVIRDMTKARDIQQRVQQQERLAAVGQLAAGIAHDFNNIMSTIVLYAQMSSQASDVSPQNRERLATIHQQAKHATKLIQQILDFSRRAVLERQPVDLSPFLKEQVKLLERTLPENIKVTLSYGRDEYTVNADPTRIQQVIMNLALNARDAMLAGGKLHIDLARIRVQPGESAPLPEMDVTETAIGEWVQLTVSDTGTGIPPDVLPRVFDPFFTTKAPGQGTGLGLAQVYGIVKQHEGAIDVESQVGTSTERPGGTTFTIYLPALPAHTAEPLTLELPALARGQGQTILVVEDNASTRQALMDSLELLNYRLLEARHGQEALAILEQHGDGVDLVISDVVMPVMGGIALLHAIRQRGMTVPVVMLTGHPLEDELEGLRAHGLVDWLPKPVSLEQLAEIVAKTIRKCE
jgi:signal transduction histidine kinase/GAF domain-containing protein